jgi:hypothetical protein
MTYISKIDFNNYIGKYIVLVTNYKTTLSKLPVSIANMQVFRYKQKYVLARYLTIEDLKDEDFVDCLHNMWKSRIELDKFLRYSRTEQPKE